VTACACVLLLAGGRPPVPCTVCAHSERRRHTAQQSAGETAAAAFAVLLLLLGRCQHTMLLLLLVCSSKQGHASSTQRASDTRPLENSGRDVGGCGTRDCMCPPVRTTRVRVQHALKPPCVQCGWEERLAHAAAWRRSLAKRISCEFFCCCCCVEASWLLLLLKWVTGCEHWQRARRGEKKCGTQVHG
jgi:hypothetical protein